MKTAFLYKPLEDKKVQCLACNRYCRILDGQTGVCGVRLNKSGKLYLTVYDRPVAVHIDPIEKKPLYHFLPGTTFFPLVLGAATLPAISVKIGISPKYRKKSEPANLTRH